MALTFNAIARAASFSPSQAFPLDARSYFESYDLAVAAALVSSYRNKPVPKGVLAFGEVGLTGEVRRVSAPERRITDGINLGFTKFIVPDSNVPMKFDSNVQIIKVKTLEQALRAMFE